MSTFLETNELVHFLSSNNTIEEEPEEYDLPEQLERQCSISSVNNPCGQVVGQDILVALLDRPNEVKDLMARNGQFHHALENYITETQGSTAWQRFETVLYKSREKMTDRSWMANISLFFVHSPVFMSKFKEIVGYKEEEDEHLPTRRLSTSSVGARRRGSRRYSNMSFHDVFEANQEKLLLEERDSFADGMFDQQHQQFYQQPNVTRRRSSCYSIQSEPHPTFIDFKIDELDEAQVNGDDSDDHLEDLLEDSDDDDDLMAPDVEQTTYVHQRRPRPREYTDLLTLRDHPTFQTNLPSTHGAFFRKAQQLLSFSPSSSHFMATARRNSILQDEIPSSPVATAGEPRFQICDDEEAHGGGLAPLLCATRREQPDDIAWLDGVMEALEGWPELVDELHDIIEESLEEEKTR
ncbi:hypothetical protein K501DRAFT_289508 [Backusella circina FSU 941]|nr:hypothetical protein K501DRAFT_289508 [Backusella circina FSU 941]